MMRWRIIYFIAPTVVFLIVSSFIGLVLKKITGPSLRLVVVMGFYLLFIWALTQSITRLAKKAEIPAPKFGSLKNLFPGMATGLILSISSALLYSLTHKQSIDWLVFKTPGFRPLLTQMLPALTEETVFRFGITHGAAELGGSLVGVAAGSVPFGLLHLVGRFFGVPVDLWQVIGVILAGLLLSVLYLRAGLWAAFGCHYVWNYLVAIWVKSMHLDPLLGTTSFEGALTTSLTIALTATLWWLLIKKDSALEETHS